MRQLLPAFALVLLAAPAIAQEAARPLSALIADLEAQGYRVTGVDVDRADIEIDATAADGRRVELRLDPATGAILSETADD
ncbi:PepSY domain-containing protein [Rubellimicrobium aerolatum]|uniref:PepSY domain-containing protein n=1 Tax=Rubellimicrobium aerolatum TaxID=490979 RepID=A0ABW0SFI5_9RHOB|nr:PepSY domain-containing protein [Rubellimicrobium aerolatum]MBP1807107.1 hypothetical protein [Rubellimicrobium aerolatum]